MTGAERTLQLVIGAVIGSHDQADLLTTEESVKWWVLFEVTSRRMTPTLAFALASVLSRVRGTADTLPLAIQPLAGAIARRLFAFANTDVIRYAELRAAPLEAVCRLFAIDPSAAEQVLRQVIESNPGSDIWIEDLQAIARAIESVVKWAPDLAGDVYAAAFEASASGAGPVPIGRSQLLQLTTTGHQNLQLVQYSIVEKFPTFLNSSPVAAAGALLRTVESLEKGKASGVPQQADLGPVLFRGHQFTIRSDYSMIWDDGQEHGLDEEPLRMLSQFQRFLEGLEDSPDDRLITEQILDVLAAEARWAVIWRRLLIAAARGGRFLQQEVAPLAESRSILQGRDVSSAVGAYLNSAFLNLPFERRESIEAAILAIADGSEEVDHRAREHTRDRLLGTLPREGIATEQARTRLSDIDSAGGPPANIVTNPVTVSPGSYEDADAEYAALSEQGVDVDDEANVKLRTLAAPVEGFVEEHLGRSVPAAGEVSAVLPQLEALFQGLTSQPAAHPAQIYAAWHHLVCACEAVAEFVRTDHLEHAYNICREILLFALESDIIDPHPRQDLDQSQPVAFCDEPNVLFHVARALAILSGSENEDAEVLAGVEQLSTHPTALIRLGTATALHALLPRHEEGLLSVLRTACQTERHPHVAAALIRGPVAALRNSHPELVAPLIGDTLDSIPRDPSGGTVWRISAQILAVTYVMYGDAACWDLLDQYLSAPERHKVEIAGALFEVRQIIQAAYTPDGFEQADAPRRRLRGWSVMLRATEVAQEALEAWQSKHEAAIFAALPDAEQTRLRNLVEILVDISHQTYFASGAFDPQDHSPLRLLNDVDRARAFLTEAGAVLDRLATVHHVQAVHHLVETLIFVAQADPAMVLCRVADVLAECKTSGYQLEPQAERLILALLNWLLADHREVLASTRSCRAAVIRLTNVFIDAGWPSMWRVAFDLDQIFR